MKIWKVLIACAFLASPAYANDSAVLENSSLKDLPLEIYQKIGNMARQNMEHAKLRTGEFVGKETPEQLADPLLKDVDRKRVVDRGIISVYAEWCGFDYHGTSFYPFMQHERRKEIWSDKQLAYMGMLHGVSMGIMGKKLKSQANCPDEMKARVNKFLVEKDG